MTLLVFFSNSYLSLRIERMSFFCCMACWVLFGSSSAKTSQHSRKTHKISNHFCSSKIIPPSAKAIQDGVGAYHSKGFVPKWLEITKHPRGLPIPEWYLNPKPYETPTKTNQGQPAPQDTPLLQPTRYHRLQATAYLTRWLKN